MMIALEWPAFGDAAKAKNADFLRLIAFLGLSFCQILALVGQKLPSFNNVVEFSG